MDFCQLRLLTVLLLAVSLHSTQGRKSDYKRIVFSEFVNNKLEKEFQAALKKTSPDVLKLYEEYLHQYLNSSVVRLQPEKKVGEKKNITIKGNRKKWLLMETIHKRRPLIFQIDDFLFDDECEYIKNAARELGLEKSMTATHLTETIFDDIGETSFEELDMDKNGYLNDTEVGKAFIILFDNRLGSLYIREIMKQTLMDFNLDGMVEQWEWKLKNLTRLVQMLNETITENPSNRIRYSEQQWLTQTDSDSPILRSIQDRLYKVTGLPLPMIRSSESLQVVHYKPGGHYDCHLDSDPSYYEDNYSQCCHLSNKEDDQYDCSACRFMTVLYYLDDTEAGGYTAFPFAGIDPYKNDLDRDEIYVGDQCTLSLHCDKSEIRMKPKKGRAVIWYNHFINPDTEWIGSVDRNSMHGGCAVNRGTKWIANNWINVGYLKKHDILVWASNEQQLREGE